MVALISMQGRPRPQSGHVEKHRSIARRPSALPQPASFTTTTTTLHPQRSTTTHHKTYTRPPRPLLAPPGEEHVSCTTSATGELNSSKLYERVQGKNLHLISAFPCPRCLMLGHGHPCPPHLPPGEHWGDEDHREGHEAAEGLGNNAPKQEPIMEESKSVVPSGAYGIPKWIMKKGMRYEVDDFIVSPPSHEDGEFLRLRYGRTHAQDMAQQEAGQDGGMTVEVRDDTLQFSTTPPTSTTIHIGPGGLSVESSPTSTPLTTPDTGTDTSNVHPLLVLPMNFGGEPKFVVKTDPVDFSKTETESFGPTASKEPAKEAATATTTTTTTRKSLEASTHPTHDNTNTLFEKVRALSLIASPIQSVEPSPVTSPHLSPRSSPLAQRRLLGMAMDPRRKISAHSYFCTKQFQDPQRDAAGNINLQQERGLSLESTMRAQQLEEGAISQQALDPKMMGRKRRQPKPSTLREMNFWAPTSM